MSFDPDPSEILLTLAEVAVTFAGFASIVAVFQQRGSENSRRTFDQFRFWIMLEFSLACLLFAIVPFAISFLGLSDSMTWSSSGILLVIFLIAHTVFLSRRRAMFATSVTPVFNIVAPIVYFLIVGAQLLNVTGLGFQREFGPYLFGVVLLLTTAATNFVRLVWVGVAPLETE